MDKEGDGPLPCSSSCASSGSGRSVLRSPLRGDGLSEEQVQRYLSFMSREDFQSLSSVSFEETVRREFRLAFASTLRSLSCLTPKLQSALTEEIAQEGALDQLAEAFAAARGGGVSAELPGEAEIAAFVRHCLAYRVHCYFCPQALQEETSAPTVQPPANSLAIPTATTPDVIGIGSPRIRRSSFKDDTAGSHAILSGELGQAILSGYYPPTRLREVPVVVRCCVDDLALAQTLSDALRAYQLCSQACVGGKSEEGERTIWLISKACRCCSSGMPQIQESFDASRGLLLYTVGVQLGQWASNLVAKGIDGPTVEISVARAALMQMEVQDFDFCEQIWMARLFSKMLKWDGIADFYRDRQICRAMDQITREPTLPGRLSASIGGVPHVVGFIGSNSFYMPWTAQLLRQFARELLRLNMYEESKEVVICTGGFRKISDRFDASDQGVGYTVGREFFDLGGHVFHILPGLAAEKDYSMVADQLADKTFLPVDYGVTLFAGDSNDEHNVLMASVCDIIFLVEGASGAALQAKYAQQQGGGYTIPVVPIRASGGAAAGLFGLGGGESQDFQLDRPLQVDPEAWRRVADPSIEPQQEMPDEEIEQLVDAMVRITWSTMSPLDCVQGMGGERAQQPSAKPWERVGAASCLKRQMGGGSHICILGSASCRHPDTESLVEALAAALAPAIQGQASLVICGKPGVQQLFVESVDSCGVDLKINNLLEFGEYSNIQLGKGLRSLPCCKDREDKHWMMANIGDVYITLEGGPATAAEALFAWERGALIVPLMRTGGASSGMFDFPAEALQCPQYVDEADWQLLADTASSVEASAAAASRIVACHVRKYSVMRKQRTVAEQDDLELPSWDMPASEFLPPRQVLLEGQAAPVAQLLEISEKGFRTYGRLTERPERTLLQILRLLECFFAEFVERSRSAERVEQMKCAYAAKGSKFRRVYSTIVEDVLSSEDGYQAFVDLAQQQSQLAKSMDDSQNIPGERLELLLAIYRAAYVAMNKLEGFCAKIAMQSGCKFLKAPLKGLYRSLEKMTFKYGYSEENNENAAAQLKDVARAALQGNMQQLHKALKIIMADDEVTLVRVKNRFAQPAGMGWADCQVVVRFKDLDVILCEIQLVHPQLMTVRSSMGAHHEYASARAAGELLSLFGQPLPSLMTRPDYA